MTTSKRIHVRGIPVDIVRKEIKHLHLGVYPPNGHIRVSAPSRVADETVRLAVISRLEWVRRQQTHFAEQARQSPREMVSGETHYFRGLPYRLRITASAARPAIRTRHRILELSCSSGATREERERVLLAWYRRHLQGEIPKLLERWEPRLGVTVSDWRVKRMKTRWGTCSRDAGRIWINLELAKKPPATLQYIVVHEMAHLLRGKHDDAFKQILDEALPGWRLHRATLNGYPLSAEQWKEC